MKDAINVVEGGGKQAVSARDLHEALEIKRDFSNWIKDRIEKYGFTEGEDYQIIVPKTGDYSGQSGGFCSPNSGSKKDVIENYGIGQYGFVEEEDCTTCSPNLGSSFSEHEKNLGGAGMNRIDYFLTLDMAKELAIVENNEKGRQVRKYLIALEKAWHSPEAVMRRSMQLAGSVLRRRGDILRMLNKAADFMMSQMPGYKGRKKAGEYLAAAAMQYKSAVYNLLLVSNELVAKYYALLHKAAFLEQHIGITDETATDMLFDTRDKLGDRWYSALGGEEVANLLSDGDIFKWPEPLAYEHSGIPGLPDLSLSSKIMESSTNGGLP